MHGVVEHYLTSCITHRRIIVGVYVQVLIIFYLLLRDALIIVGAPGMRLFSISTVQLAQLIKRESPLTKLKKLTFVGINLLRVLIDSPHVMLKNLH